MLSKRRDNPDARWQVEPDADEEAAYTVLSQDRIWNAYSIADLVPPFRAGARVALAWMTGQVATAACLFLRHPRFNATVPYGDPHLASPRYWPRSICRPRRIFWL